MRARRAPLLIPELCKNSSLLLVLIVTQLAVSVVWLANFRGLRWEDYGLFSFYALGLVVLITLALCGARQWIARQHYWLGVITVIAISLLAMTAVELVVWKLSCIEPLCRPNSSRIVRLMLVVLIVVASCLRIFHLLSTLESRSKSESEARINALQSRIQPHFLFNSLNTIAELTVADPEQAEEAINSLSMLFRVSLEEGSSFHSLDKELRLCERYVDLERWRYAQGIAYRQSIDVATPQQWRVPKLLLQPLIENALKYGTARTDQSKPAVIELNIKETEKFISVRISNPVDPKQEVSPGHGMATDNIRERLFVLYDDQQSFNIRETDKRYQVTIQIPRQTL